MTETTVDGSMLRSMFIQGANNLGNNVDRVDALNVFPVPDGDTGTNMNLTVVSGVKEIQQLHSANAGQVAKSFSKGLLMGARGNSGVILSQLFRGFSKPLADANELDSKQLAKAFETSVDTAYQAVMKPVEGTILTVAKDAAKAAKKAAKKETSIKEMLHAVVAEANASLERTPDLLPVLKEVGVVDSGGQGLVHVYEGMLAAARGEEVTEASSQLSMDEHVQLTHHQNAQSQLSAEDIEFGYCTEVMVRFEDSKLEQHPYNEEGFREELGQYGDSLLVVSDEDLLKIHIHAEEPGEILSLSQRFGELVNIKIENMREQHSALTGEKAAPAAKPSPVAEKAEQVKEQKPFAVVTVAMGDGIYDLFKGLGADVVIEGGQTMNPSTEDIVRAIQETNAEQVFVLPNNGNIVMAAEQAAEVSEQQVQVIATKSVPQGLAAMFAFEPERTTAENEEAMKEGLTLVTTGQVTHAVRDTTIEGHSIKEGDFMGICESEIVSSGQSVTDVAERLVQAMVQEDTEIVTILTGADAKEENTSYLVDYIEKEYDDVEVEVHAGKQPLYDYILASE
ncbi:DAK2 domain-containing protein [Salsuginibacillus kocurii]|uniref:DAK2 domain-containing protein n=1 Tax=Salsuginibacillus kocurii TaxID=427078 RepID=UPI000375C6BB|nr:DAK2 domain-containing protein [Salsuginibacillus kocurii]